MRIAVLTFGTRVSPRFDHAPELLLVEERGGQVTGTQRIRTDRWHPAERVGRLSDLQVDVLICGGISGFLARQLDLAQIEVYSWVTGEAEDALRCLLAGQLEPGVMTGPQGPCGRWRLGAGRGRWGQRGRGGGSPRGPR